MGLSKIKDRITEFFKNSPKAGIYLAAAAVCAALLLMFRAQRSPETPKEEPIEPEVKTIMDYADSLEEELKGIISEIQGVGEASVMVTVRGSEEKVFARDTSGDEEHKDEKTVLAGNKDAILQNIRYPEVTGVLIVCTGGEKPTVKEKVVNAVSTVLNIPTGKVYVTNRK